MTYNKQTSLLTNDQYKALTTYTVLYSSILKNFTLDSLLVFIFRQGWSYQMQHIFICFYTFNWIQIYYIQNYNYRFNNFMYMLRAIISPLLIMLIMSINILLLIIYNGCQQIFYGFVQIMIKFEAHRKSS